MSNNKFPTQSVFTHSTPTHQFEIKWTRAGNPSGPPVAFIHGTPWSSVVWQDLASALQDHYCIYLYDHPGFERSPQPTRQDGKEPDLDPSLTLRAEASAALFKHWNLSQPPHVLAHDNGGLVSLRLLLEHGIRFSSLCLIDVVALGPFGLPLFDLVANNLAVFQKLPPGFQEGFIRSYIKSALHKPDMEIESMLAAQWLEDGVQGFSRFLQEILQAHNRVTGDIEKQYSTVGSKLPVKVIWGNNDSWLPSKTAQRLGDALNAREIVLIDEAAHLVHYDQPGKLAFEVGTWLIKNTAS
ncbi:MAG: hypothetical protein M1828_006853 [Chrysothrix sp. TS-e1954]|nr:MAG: hypothetical protein M1828_006853 [Chrysothrix sp. TS-e1954]